MELLNIAVVQTVEKCIALHPHQVIILLHITPVTMFAHVQQ